MRNADLQSIAEYGLSRMAGGVPVWPLEIEPILPLFTMVNGRCNVLENVCPKPATPKELSGKSWPAVQHLFALHRQWKEGRGQSENSCGSCADEESLARFSMWTAS